MILTYGDKRTREFADGKRVKAFDGIQRPASSKLAPGNRFEGLKGDRKGQYSIRINDQWRVCFEWPKGATGPMNVSIVDYH